MTSNDRPADDAWASEGEWVAGSTWDDEAPAPAPAPPRPATLEPAPAPAPARDGAAPRRRPPRVAPADPVERIDPLDPVPVLEEDFPPPRRGRAVLGFLVFLLIAMVGALVGVRWFQNQLDPPGPPRESIEVLIPPNTSTARIARILHEQGVIGNATVFRYWVQVKGKGGFEAGKYEFRKNSSFESVLGTLQEGPAVPDEQKITIPEGFRITQIGARIENRLPGRTAAKFEAALGSGAIRSAYQPSGVKNLEGFLFPDTYTFGLDDDEGIIAARMIETFDGVADQVNLLSAPDTAGVTPYEALIVASLVEREAKKEGDRAKIARVIYNRIKAEMYLQIDAGIIYAMNNGTTRLFENDYKLDSPYNTYNHKGLPPTPIASPGRASIEAALHPAEGDWLYYVVTQPDGSHSFAVTYKEHLRNIKIAEKNGVR